MSTRLLLTYAMDLTFKPSQPLSIRHENQDDLDSPDKPMKRVLLIECI